jgi:2-keto-4-pentenoate hydratase/2-oxohepta-3-ene-1,7-dioic acid hydratase in catechol pathway
MQLVMFDRHDGVVRPGAQDNGAVVDLSPVGRDIATILAMGAPALDAARRQVGDPGAARLPLEHVRLLAPLPRPGKIICLAGNYVEHQKEGKMQVVPKAAQSPWLFMKPSTTVIGPEQPIRLPARLTDEVDWECELGVVIGASARDVPASRALEYVAGYTVFNDISARRIAHAAEHRVRERDPFHDWLHGKWFDTFGPMGPCLVTRDEIPDPQALQVELRLNGEVRQQASTGDMIFGVAELIEFISGFLTLEPGDLISTGTPAGVGKATGRLLRPGDVLEARIERIGVLRNPVEG